MKKQTKDKTLLSMVDCLERLRLPGATVPASHGTIYNYMEELEITPHLKKDGPGKKKLFIEECDCQRIEERFKQKHWRLFREAERGKGKA